MVPAAGVTVMKVVISIDGGRVVSAASVVNVGAAVVDSVLFSI